MKFAINYSPQAAELVRAGRIQIDYFKCPNWPHLVAEARQVAPVAVHIDLVAGSGRLEQRIDWAEIETLLAQTATPYINVHLDPPLKDYPEVQLDRPTPTEAARLMEAMARDLAFLVRRFGARRIIAENAPYHASQGHVIRTAVEPEQISRLVNDAGVGLLLDLSHASISANYLHMDEWDYFAQLPVSRLRELHFTGIHLLDGRLSDHLPALPADWATEEY